MTAYRLVEPIGRPVHRGADCVDPGPDRMSRRPHLSDEERRERVKRHQRAYRERTKIAKLEGNKLEDRRRHLFRDPGPADPEAILAAAFNAARCDYGGALPADFVLRTVLHAADRLIADASQDVLQSAEARSQGKKIPGQARKRLLSSAQVDARNDAVC
jgi:hypothetical protein